MIASTRNIYVKGTVNGQVTVYTRRKIYITNDIVYAEDPRENPASDDVLGLLARKNVIVKDNAPNRDDCIIHASIMSVQGSFTVENYDQGSPRGTLHVLGGIIQETRGPVGTFSWWGPATGYQKDYQYDSRLLAMAPPYFPVSSKMSVLGWDE